MFFRMFGQAINACLEAHRVIARHNLWIYVLVPGFISLVYAAGLAFLAYTLGDNVAQFLTSWIGWDWLRDLVAGIIYTIWWSVMAVTLFLTYRFVVLVSLSPFLTALSAKVEQYEFGAPAVQTSFREAIQDILRALALNLRNLLLEMLISIPMYFIPLLNPFGLFFLQSYYAGFGLMDYTLERHRFTVGQTVEFVQRHKGIAMGTGTAFNLITMIPVVGWFIAPAYCTVSATLVTYRNMEQPEQKTF